MSDESELMLAGEFDWAALRAAAEMGIKAGNREWRWRAILEAADVGTHVSTEVLRALVDDYGLPPGRPTAYFSDRHAKGQGLPGRPSNPASDPPDPHFPEWAHPRFEAGPIPWSGRAEKMGKIGNRLTKFATVAAVRRRHHRYKGFFAKTKPNRRNLPALKEVAGGWKVRDAKARALEKIARAWSVAPKTLERWEEEA